MENEDKEKEIIDLESKDSIPHQISDIQRCPECGGTRLMRDYESAEVVCMECGFVVDM